MTKGVLLFLFMLGCSPFGMDGQVAVTGQIRGVVTDASGLGAHPSRKVLTSTKIPVRLLES